GMMTVEDGSWKELSDAECRVVLKEERLHDVPWCRSVEQEEEGKREQAPAPLTLSIDGPWNTSTELRLVAKNKWRVIHNDRSRSKRWKQGMHAQFKNRHLFPRTHSLRGFYRGITATALHDTGYGASFTAHETTHVQSTSPGKVGNTYRSTSSRRIAQKAADLHNAPTPIRYHAQSSWSGDQTAAWSTRSLSGYPNDGLL
ncbi:hypothetical protein K466DRAFT_571192, partial [Polyporus arcularius HHB13444]